jgi:hypothetical protein
LSILSQNKAVLNRIFLTLGLLGFGMVAASAAQRIDIDLTNQRAYLIQDGRVIIDAPICSGRSGHETPTGVFQVTDKDRNHSSSLYGFFGNPRTHQIVNPNVDRDMPVPKGLEFVNAPMHYYLQFLPAIGLHAGYLPGHPDSHGCVRMPKEYATQFFRSVTVGTPVHVYGEPEYGREYVSTSHFSSPTQSSFSPVTTAPATQPVSNGGFTSEWDANAKAIDREIASLKRKAKHVRPGQRMILMQQIESYEEQKAGLNIRRQAAQAALFR